MKYNNLSFSELKQTYDTRPGFVFMGMGPSSRESCEKLYKQIKEFGLCDYEPDFISEVTPTVYAFVYPEGVSFHSADFYTFANHLTGLVGLFKVDSLAAFLKDHG